MKLMHLLHAAALALVLTACNQKDLCDDHWEHAPKLDFRVGIDWRLAWQQTVPGGPDWKADWNADRFGMTYESLLPAVPDGVRAMVYNSYGNTTMSNLSATGGKLNLTEGEHQLLFFNNDTEYIVFNDMYTTATAKATTRAVSRASFNADSSPVQVPGAQKTVSPPDCLFGCYIEHFDAQRKPEQQTISATMKPLVYTYLIRYKFDSGMNYVALARGALMGVAGSVYLTDGRTGTETVSVIYDCQIKNGYVEAKVNSFGAPDYPGIDYNRAEHPYALNLEVRLTNGTIKNFNFDITSQMEHQPRGGVIEVGGLVVTDQEGSAETSGGFDVEVEGWGDYIDVPIQLGSGQ